MPWQGWILMIPTTRQKKNSWSLSMVQPWKAPNWCIQDAHPASIFMLALDNIDRLCAALHLPDTMRAPNRTCWSGREGLYILLNRLVDPSRLATLMRTLGRGRSEMSLIINCTLDFLYVEWNHLHFDPFWQIKKYIGRYYLYEHNKL